MFKSLKNQTTRILASVLAVVMTLTVIPVGTYVTTFAATTEYPDSLTITVSDAEGLVADAEVKVVSASEAFSKTENTDTNGVIAIGSAELETYLGENEEDFKITITKDGYKVKNETVTLDKSKTTENFDYEIEKIPAIEGVNVTAYVGKYDESKHNAVSITGTKNGDTITYSTDGGVTFTAKMPTVENPDDSVKVIVKVERTDYLTFTSDEVTASVSKGEITGITVTSYADKAYDGETHDAVVVEGAKEGDTVTYSTDDVDYSESVPTITTPGSLTGYVKIVRNDKYEEYKQSFDASVINATIQGVEVKPYIGVYDEAEHPAVTVEGTKEGDIITFSTDGVNYSTVVPTIQDVGSKDVHVKVQREYHDDLPTPPAELKVTATVSQAEIKGVTATGYSAKYDKKSHDAVTSVTGTIEGDIVTYSNEENGTYTSTIPTVKKVKDSGTYYVKIHRNDNYKDLIIPVAVSITRNDQQTISFGTTSNVVYNENNTFTYVIETRSADDAEGKITYKVIGGTADAEIKTSDKTTGKVTYTSVGTVRVEATIEACDNYESAKDCYEIEIKYPTAPNYTITSADYIDDVTSLKWHRTDVVIAAEGWTVVEGTNAVDTTGWTENITKTVETEYNFVVAFKNKTTGDITDKISIPKFAIDKTKPLDVEATFVDKHTDLLSKVFHYLSFGLFCNEAVEITVVAKDDANSVYSGIKEIRLFKTADGKSEELVGRGTSFTIPVGFVGTFRLEVEDFAGNVYDQKITEANSNMTDVNGYVMIENTAPIVSDISDVSIVDKQASNVHKYSSDVKIQFTAEDKDSGLYQVRVALYNGNINEYVNDYLTDNDNANVSDALFAIEDSKLTTIPVNVDEATDKTDTPIQYNAQNINKYTYSATTEQTDKVRPLEDGSYNYVVLVIDNAGNVTGKYLRIEKDLTAPVITNFDFKVGGSLVSNETLDIDNNTVIVNDYGFYFKEPATVYVTAKDMRTEYEMASGVKTIVYKALDITEGIVVSGRKDVDSENTIDFTLPANFKGQIYAYAIDNVGNDPTKVKVHSSYLNDGFVADKDNDYYGYTYPSGSIVESAKKHEGTSSIEIEALTPATAAQNETYTYDYKGSAQKDATMSYDDAQKVPLYKANPTFELVVKDEYSGIREIKVTVIENGVSTVKTLSIDNAGTKTGDEVDAWAITKEANTNLVASASRTIEINGNFNNMVILVELTDRAGNSSYDYYTFGIDKTNPVITVEMNDDDFDKYDGFFKADRTATVTINERNFQDGLVTFTITLTDDKGNKKDVEITDSFVKGETVNDGTHEYFVYKLTHTFSDEGDYTFDIKAKDLATNDNDEVSYVNEQKEDIKAISTAFTVDKTLPTVNVVYDNNSAMNGNYYKADRTATITITEHNFVAEDVVIAAISNATNDGQPSTFPTVSAWKDNGDNTHTATISYSVDSKYTFDIEFLDKSGNSIANYAPDEFYIDKTAPALEITGVADKSANNGDVAPIITYSDVNFNKDAVSIVLAGVNNGTVNYSGAYTDNTHGQTYTYANFEKVQKVDDIYTLTAKLTDMAGNETEKTITFSANRFGSVYDLSKAEDIINKYLQTEEDIVFTETNVDALERDGILVKLTKNGTPTDLVEGTDYTVEVSGGSGQWSVYTYTVNKKLFTDDGRYSISVYSKDAAGNVNENIEESKEAEISFGIDKTKPVIVPIDFESGKQYDLEVKTVSVEIKDNLVLEGVEIYLNGEEIEYKVDGETYTFDIPKSNSKQDVKIVAVDAAGNEQPIEITDFLVNDNFFVRWYNNTPLFIGSIIGVVVITLGVVSLLLFGKKKKEDDK